jgi:hypothetical protein
LQHIFRLEPAFPPSDGAQYDDRDRLPERGSLKRDPARLELTVDAGPGADGADLDRLARSLRDDLVELEVDRVELVPDEPPEGARAAEALVAGALLVQLARTSDALSTLVRTIRGWLGASGGRTVRIELDGDVLEVSGVSDAERERLVETWIARHAGR